MVPTHPVAPAIHPASRKRLRTQSVRLASKGKGQEMAKKKDSKPSQAL
jgi:hypothetical protein